MSVPTPSGHRLETDYDRRRLRQWLAGEAKVTHRLPLTEAPTGYDLFKNKKDHCEKVVLTP